MRHYSTVLLFLISFVAAGRAQSDDQITAIGSNLLRVGSGHTTPSGGETIRKNYLEEIANARIFFKNISIGLRYEMDDPSEVGRSIQGIRRRWIQYQKDRLNLQAGDVSALFGRGLTLNLFESRPLNYDSWLDGVYADYGRQWSATESELRPSFQIKGIAGKTTFYPVIDAELPIAISARAINGEVGIWGKKLILGGSFLQAFTTVVEPTTAETRKEVDQPGAYLRVFSGEFEAFLEWTQMRTIVLAYNFEEYKHFTKGGAVYGTVSYANEDFGATIEYKDYRYLLRAPSMGTIETPGNRVLESQASRLPLSSPPEVYKEYTYTSITRGTHAVNFDDEVGAQVELSLTSIPGVGLSFNAAAASRHKAYSNERDSADVSVEVGDVGFLPELKDNRFSPFWEASLEAEISLDDENSYLKAIIHRRSDVVAYNATDNRADLRATTTLAAKLQYTIDPSQSLLVIFEHQWMRDYSPEAHYRNDLITVQYSPIPSFSLGGMFDYSTFYGNPSFAAPRHIWPQVFTSVRIGQAHTLLASYGAERGGINCAGGICRFVPPFDGLRLTLTSQL